MVLALALLSGPATAFTPFAVEGEPLLEPAVPVYENPAPAATSADRIRVAFYNIEMFTDGIRDGRTRTPENVLAQAQGAAGIVEEINPDILIVAEIENASVLSMLNAALTEPYPVGHIVQFGTGGRRAEKMNIAMLSRFTPESVHEIDFGPLTGPGRPTRGVFRAIFDLGDQHFLLVYASHLKSNWGKADRNYSQRYHGMKLMLDDKRALVAAHPGRTWEVMYLGDVNTDPAIESFADDPTLGVIGHWHDMWAEHPDVATIITVPTRYGDPYREFPPALFDRILVHPGLREAPWSVTMPGVLAKGTETNDVNTLPGQGGHISDHYPIFIDAVR